MAERAYNEIGSTNSRDIVKGYAEDNCDHLGVSHTIQASSDLSYNAYQTCSEDNGNSYPNQTHDHEMDCLLDDFESWVNGHTEEGSDFNLMILLTEDYNGSNIGGLARVGGNAAVVRGAVEIDQNSNQNRPRYYSSNYWLHAAMHEIGHNLHLSHWNKLGDGLIYQYMYENYHGQDRFGRTPHSPTPSKNENACGQTNQDSGWDPLDRDCYFWDPCAGDTIREAQ